MYIYQAKPEEYQDIRAFYHSLIDALEGLKYTPAWKKDIYPSPEDLRNATAHGWLYYGKENGRIAASMVLNRKYNEEYNRVLWKADAAPEEILVIHMLGVHRDFIGHGFGKEMVRFAFSLARNTGVKAIRLDVLKGNLPAEKLYESLGFEYITTLPMFYEDTGWTEFELYEYRL